MFTRILAFVKGMVHRNRIDTEVDDELRFHIEMATQANIKRGMAPEEAQRAAMRDLGGLTHTKEAVREVRSGWLDSITQDIRYAWRMLVKHPTSSIVGILVLALGVSVNTALFSIVNAFLFRPLPVRAPGELRFVYLQYLDHPQPPSGIAYKEYEYLRANANVFRQVCAHKPDRGVLGVGDNAIFLTGEAVSANYFDVLGVTPRLGRTLASSDEKPDATPVVVISHALWQSRFNQDPGIVGRVIRLDVRLTMGSGRAASQMPTYTVVGVMRPDFRGTVSNWEPSDYWVPAVQRVADYEIVWGDALRQGLDVVLIARLRAGVSEDQARTALEIQNIAWRGTEHPDTREHSSIALLHSPVVAYLPFDTSARVVPNRLALALSIVTGIVLLVATTNLTGLLKARAMVRREEIAVRLALGAGKWRVARQVLTENLVLSLAGGALAIVLGRWLVAMFVSETPALLGGRWSPVTRLSLDVDVDWRVLMFTAAVCVVAAVLTGLGPARQATRTDLVSVLSGSAIGQSRRKGARLHMWILVPQVCLSLALLVAAGPLIRALMRAENSVSRGYDPAGVVFIEYQLPLLTKSVDAAKFRAASEAVVAQRKAFETALLKELGTVPGASASALVFDFPWDNRFSTSVLAQKDYAHPVGANRWVAGSSATPGFFEAFGIPILKGRGFTAHDLESSSQVAIVCEELARRLWPGEEVLGKHLAKYDPKDGGRPVWSEVVGVAKSIRPARWDDVQQTVYFPFGNGLYATTAVLRGRGAPRELIAAATAAIKRAEPGAMIMRSGTATESIDGLLYPRRMATGILVVCGLLGLFLATIGFYGVVSYSVAQRTRELGIRSALGAAHGDIVRLVMRDGMRVVALSAIGGITLALGASKVAASLVVAIPAVDLLTLLVVPAFLAVVILLACYIPARRASRVDPLVALRDL